MGQQLEHWTGARVVGQELQQSSATSTGKLERDRVATAEADELQDGQVLVMVAAPHVMALAYRSPTNRNWACALVWERVDAEVVPSARWHLLPPRSGSRRCGDASQRWSADHGLSHQRPDGSFGPWDPGPCPGGSNWHRAEWTWACPAVGWWWRGGTFGGASRCRLALPHSAPPGDPGSSRRKGLHPCRPLQSGWPAGPSSCRVWAGSGPGPSEGGRP